MYFILKRFFDCFFSFILLLIISPAFIVLFFLIICDLRCNPLFFQKRAGLHGKPFNVIKFKTMSECKDINGDYLPDHLRITSIGNFLRRFSLDELPQLFNVFIGDMSFIGPRPFLFEYMYIYSDAEKKRHNVRPGISGWAQVNGRNNLLWKDKFKLDLYYVENVSASLDFKIFVLTLYKLINNSDINQNSNVTMEKYNGKN